MVPGFGGKKGTGCFFAFFSEYPIKDLFGSDDDRQNDQYKWFWHFLRALYIGDRLYDDENRGSDQKSDTEEGDKWFGPAMSIGMIVIRWFVCISQADPGDGRGKNICEGFDPISDHGKGITEPARKNFYGGKNNISCDACLSCPNRCAGSFFYQL